MIRTFAAAALLGAAALSPLPAHAQAGAAPEASLDPVRVQLGREIVELGFPQDTRESMFMGVVDQMIAQMEQARGKSDAELDAASRDYIEQQQRKMIVDLKALVRRHIPSLIDGVALAYADQFDERELRDIRAFVATPSGQAFVSRSAELISNPYYVAATQPYLNEVMAKAQDWQRRMVAGLVELHGQK